MADCARQKQGKQPITMVGEARTRIWLISFRRFTLVLLLVSTHSLSGCSSGPDSPRGFSLPKGSAQDGKQAFIDLDCTACHSVFQLDLPPPEEMFETSVVLGGPRKTQISYGELVTSIIKPSYKLAKGYRTSEIEEDGESKMPIYNDVMTVTQMIDIVTFLEEHYEVLPYDPAENAWL